MLEIRLLGQFDVRFNGQPVEIPSRPAQSLLSYLALTTGVAHRRERLAGLFWPDSSDANARGYLRQTLWRLRRALETNGTTYFAADDLTIAFDPTSPIRLDVADLSRDATPATSTDDLLHAVSAYGGELLPGFHDEWVQGERERLEALFETRISLLLDRLVEERRWPEVLEWGECWISMSHAPEPAYRALMTAHRALGDVSGMAAVYQRCVDALQRELGVDPSPATRELYEQLSKDNTPGDRLTSAAYLDRKPSLITAPVVLPNPLTRFIGRENEVAQVKGLLVSSRLLTITGVGGVGKTRLALRAAGEAKDDFQHGIWFVELAPLTDASLVARTVATALGMAEEGNRPVAAALSESLRTKQGLLILDNCEHVINAVAQLAESLLHTCPQLHVIATSREALGVAGETIFQVPSLSVPNTDEPISLEALQAHDSIRLFIDRAATAVSDFALTSQNAPAIIEICRRLDGIPLALELAAARVKTLPPDQIAARLNDRFHLLTGGSRTVLPRQQTLRATMDWSYNLLTESERIVLRRLSVFISGWTLEAAEAVCTDSTVEHHDILDLLTQLLNKSLVIAQYGNETRYRMLETIRGYALEKLADSDDAHTIRDRHLAYFLALAEQAEPQLTGPQQVLWLNRFETELDNVRAALEWAKAYDPLSGLKLASALSYFWDAMDRFSEGSHWLGKFLDRPEVEAHPLVRAKGLAVQSLLLVTNDLPAGYANAALSLELFKNASNRSGEALSLLALGVTQAMHGDFVLARPLLDKSLNLYEALGDKLGQSNVLSWLTLDRHCDVEQSTSFIERSLALSREIGHTLGILSGLVGLAQQYYWTGNFKRAETFLEEAAIVQQQLNSRSTQAWVLDMRGNMAHRNGNLDEAEMHYLQSILLNEESGHHVHGMWAKSNLAAIATQRGDFVHARELLTMCALKFKEAEIENGVVYCLENFANLAIKQSDLPRAATLLSWADAYRHHIGDVRPLVEQKVVDKAWIYLHSSLDAEALEAANAQGRRMTLSEAMAYSLETNP